MNAFDWKHEPSAIAKALNGNPARAAGGAKSGGRFRQYETVATINHNAGKKVPGFFREKNKKKQEALASIIGISATRREQEIRRCRREIQRHQDLALTHESEGWRAHHANKVRELEDKAARLVAMRPAGFVEKREVH